MRSKTAAATIAVAFAALPALAREHGEEAAATGLSPFAGNVGNAVWTLVIFVLVVVVLGKFAWKPILKALQDRESFIHDALAAAKRDREQAEARLKEYTDRLVGARTEATAIVDEARRDAEVVKRKILEEAHDEQRKELDRAKREIALAKETAVKELYTLSAKLTTEVASRVLRREVNAADHERLIKDAIAELGSAKNAVGELGSAETSAS
jgi:F-type H+-transporting ATPase subunit b